jgi:Domain of unknown function (DUF5658)
MKSNFPKWKLGAFALLSACDFFTTYLLLSSNDEAVYESNPVANSWLQSGGWLGLALFKMAIVVIVGFIATYLYYRRPRVAHDLLAVGCGAVVVAVLTGTSIAFSRSSLPQEEAAIFVVDVAPQRANPDPRTVDYAQKMDEAVVGLITREIDLPQAVELLSRTQLAKEPSWIRALHRAFPGVRDERALLAADLIQNAVISSLRTPQAAALADRLEDELQRHYGVVHAFSYRSRLQHKGSAPQIAVN